MTNKILWLSILGLALARPPNPIDSTASNFGEEQKQRNSRSIWPFTSSETTTEAPVNYPASLLDNNEWFVQGETPLPQGIDLKKYPVWKVHKYNGIDLHPVNLQPENTYPPEQQRVTDPGYSTGASSSSDFSQNNYETGYKDFSTGYPTAYSSPPIKQGNYQTGESHSSSFSSDFNPFNIQTQRKYETYAAPQPHKDFQSTGVPEVSGHSQYTSTSYGLPNAYQTGNVNFRGENQEAHRQVFTAGEEHSQSSNGRTPDLSFLDDLGGLAPFLPEPKNDEEVSEQVETETPPEPGFFERILSTFRGSSSPAAENSIIENKKPANSGGFLSSIFGTRTDSESPETDSATTETSGNSVSSLFYQPETDGAVPIQPTTYYLPKTRGSYIAVKVPNNAAPNFTPYNGQYNDVSNIPFHQVPKVPFNQHEIPQISSPTLDSAYPYELGYSEIRNSGAAGSAVNSDHQYSTVGGQSYQSNTRIAPHVTQQRIDYYRSDFGSGNVASYQGDALEVPRVEYNNGQEVSRRSSSPTINYQQGLQDFRKSGNHKNPSTGIIQQSVEDKPSGTYSYNGNEFDQNQNENRNLNLNNQQYQYQNFDATNSDFQGTSFNTQDTSDHLESQISSDPQISNGFVPSLGYSVPVEGEYQGNSNPNQQKTTNTNEQIAYDHSFGNIDDNNDSKYEKSSVLSGDLLLPKETLLVESFAPVYQGKVTNVDNPEDIEEVNGYAFHQINEANNNGEISSDRDDADNRFIQNISTLTSHGVPSNSYRSNSLAPVTWNIVAPTPMKDEVNDGVSINMNKDVFRSTLPEQLPTKKVDRVVRKVMKRRNFLESNNSRRSIPRRQASTEETDTSLIIRSEKDLIPEVGDSRQFHGAQIIDGYSKIHHGQHRVVEDTGEVVKSLDPALE